MRGIILCIVFRYFSYTSIYSVCFVINILAYCSGFCTKCAMQLEICPLCRKPIEQVDNDYSNTCVKASSDQHLRSQLSHDKSMAVSNTSSHGDSDESIKWTTNGWHLPAQVILCTEDEAASFVSCWFVFQSSREMNMAAARTFLKTKISVDHFHL